MLELTVVMKCPSQQCQSHSVWWSVTIISAKHPTVTTGGLHAVLYRVLIWALSIVCSSQANVSLFVADCLIVAEWRMIDFGSSCSESGQEPSSHIWCASPEEVCLRIAYWLRCNLLRILGGPPNATWWHGLILICVAIFGENSVILWKSSFVSEWGEDDWW